MAQASHATVDSLLAQFVVSAPDDALAPDVASAPEDPLQNSPCTCEGQPTRSLIVCIDGTSNQFSKYNTNVVELYNRLTKDETQLTYYNSGIGTYAKPSWFSPTYIWQWISSAIDLLFARRIDRSVKQAYQWLSEQYRPGDRIYLFGFSRGAYQVRILASMIDTVGLLHKGNLDQIPFAYRLYFTSQDSTLGSEETPENSGGREDTLAASRRAGQSINAAAQVTSDPKEPEPTTKEVLASFKRAFSHKDVRVHFVGVWDTVSSVGIFYNKTLPGTTTGMEHVCFFRHALALHERRVRFLPEYAHGGPGDSVRVAGPATRPGESTNAGGEDLATLVTPPRIKEVWFQGCHSDIGGGNIPNVKLQIFGPALRWMYFEARTAGLTFNPPPEGWEPLSRVHNSMSWGWRMVEYVPLTHRSYRRRRRSGSDEGETHDSDPGQVETWWRCHRGAPRVIPNEHLIHATARESNKIKRPVATFEAGSSRSWENLTSDDIEPDPYLNAERVINFLSSLRGTDSLPTLKSENARLLKVLLSTEPGRLSFGKAARVHPDSAALLYLLFYNYLPATQPTESGDHGKALEELRKAKKDVCDMLQRLPHITRRIPFPEMISALCELRDEDVAATKNGIATLPIAVSQTIPLLKDSGSSTNIPWIAYTQHQRKLSCLSTAFGLSNRDVDYQDVHYLKPRHDPSTVSEVAYAALYSSSDSEHLVTGTRTGLLQDWSVKTGKLGRASVQLEVRHDHQLYTRVDTRVDPIDTSILGWTDAAVTCLTASPDGRILVTAWRLPRSSEASLAIYDLAALLADSSSSVAPIDVKSSGHLRLIASVEYSSHASSVLTASWDGDVKIWSLDGQGKFVGDARTLVGHTRSVNHAVYSTDGTLIASGSDDCTVIVWNAETGAQLLPLEHEDFVYCVAFSPDASKVLSGSLDRTFRLWKIDLDKEEGEQLGVYRSHPAAVTCVTFKPDGKQFASASQDGTVLQWSEWTDSELDNAIKEYRAAQNALKNSKASQT